MGPELESNGKSGVTPEAPSSKENGVVSADSTEKCLKCDTNYGGSTLEVSGCVVEPLVACRSNEAEAGVTRFTNPGVDGLVKAECQEATENSSSFDETNSGIENSGNLSDSEVMSSFHTDGSSALPLNGFPDIFRLRKKKLTSHWRTFVRPLMWRCKWAELQIKKFDALAQKYNRELAEYNQRKQFLTEKLEMQGTCMRSFPFSNDSPRDKVLRRKKRKRTEETTNAASYMSLHNLFSYYEKRNRTTDGTYADAYQAGQDRHNMNLETGSNNEGLWLESRSGDNLVEEMFRKIERLQSQVRNLKSRINKVKSENPEKLSSADDLDLPSGLTSSARSLNSPPNDGDRMPVGSSNIASQLLLEYNKGNMVMTGSAVSSHVEASRRPDAVESTNQSLLGATCANAEDDILIYNGRMNEEITELGEVTIKCAEKPQVAEAHKASTSPTVPVVQDLTTDDQPAPKIRSIAKLTAPTKIKKKKRGKRKPSW